MKEESGKKGGNGRGDAYDSTGAPRGGAPKSASAPQDEKPREEAGIVETPAEESARLRTELEARTAEAAANHDLYLRATAELENYKKRSEREKADIKTWANETLMSEILPVVDNLERALEHAASTGDNVDSLRAGVELTVSQFFAALKKFGLEEIKAMGEKFDPALHHAISHEASSGSGGVEVVVKEFQKGYTLKGRLLRPSMVAVSTGAGEGASGS